MNEMKGHQRKAALNKEDVLFHVTYSAAVGLIPSGCCGYKKIQIIWNSNEWSYKKKLKCKDADIISGSESF